MAHKGYDVFFVEPGSVTSMRCAVCGRALMAERDHVGPTSTAEAMSGHKRQHDLFLCPHTEEPWHREALALVQAIKQTPSQRVAGLIKQDLTELLAAHP